MSTSGEAGWHLGTPGGQDVDHARREPGLDDRLAEPQDAQRVLWRRLDDARVAHCQGRGDLAGHVDYREVVRGYAHHHADRATVDHGTHQAGRTEGRRTDRGRPLGRVDVTGSRVVAEPVDRRPTHLHGPGHPEGGARLGLDQRHPLFHPLFQHVGQPGQVHAALLHRQGAPGRLGRGGRGDRAVRIRDRGVGGVPDRTRGVGIDDLIGVGGGDPLPPDEEPPLLLCVNRGHGVSPSRLCVRFPGRRTRMLVAAGLRPSTGRMATV